MMNSGMTAICEELLDRAAGGAVNNNPSPANMTGIVDETINGRNYDAIAQMIADWLNGYDVRTRIVDNSQNIYDFIV